MTKFKNVFVQPAAGDAGGSLGSALFTWHELSKKRSPELKVPFLGPSFSQKKVDDFFKEKYKCMKFMIYPIDIH